MILKCAAAALVTLTGPAWAQGMDILHPVGPYTQQPTGMIFPVSVGDFQRVEILRYSKDGTDESGGYNYTKPMNEIVATVYVFPSPRVTSIGSPENVVREARDTVCQQQFKGVEKEVMTAHPNATLIGDGPVTLLQPGKSYSGYKASYDLTSPRAFGRTNVAARSEAYIFCFAGGKWTVEYRIDYPRESNAAPLIAAFMRDLTWTIPPEGGH
jgi:hypothetical protein